MHARITPTYLVVGVPDEVIFYDFWLSSSPRLFYNLSILIPTFLKFAKEEKRKHEYSHEKTNPPDVAP